MLVWNKSLLSKKMLILATAGSLPGFFGLFDCRSQFRNSSSTMQNNWRSIQSIQNTFWSHFCLIFIFPAEVCLGWPPIWFWLPICSMMSFSLLRLLSSSFSLFRRRARISRPLLSTLSVITMIIFAKESFN